MATFGNRERRTPLSTGGWRETITSLKQRARSGAGVSSSEILAAVQSLGAAGASNQSTLSDEVVEAVAFLATQLAATRANGAAAGPGRAAHETELAFCQLICQLLFKKTSKLPAQPATQICSTLRNWAGPSNGEASDEAQLQQEALTALNSLFTDNAGQVAASELSTTLGVLLLLAQSKRPTTALQPVSARRAETIMETQRLAVQVLGAMCLRGASSLSADDSAALLRCVTGALQAATVSGQQLFEDAVHSRFYATLLKTLSAVLAEVKKGWQSQVPGTLESLRRFMLYGLTPFGMGTPTPQLTVPPPQPGSPSASKGPPTPSSAAGGGTYQPPHLRNKAAAASRRVSASGGDGTSDSDASDSEGALGAALDRHKSSRVRLALLVCLQAMAKTDPRALHPHWSSILPLQQPLQPRPLTPHLVTMLLFDPMPKVRSMAAATVAALLEGPAQRSFLAVAEAKSVLRQPARGFTSLSESLGQMVLSLHTGLLHAVTHETSTAVLSVALRGLHVLLCAAPFERLPPTLLPEVVQVVRSRLNGLKVSPAGREEELAAIHAAAMACLAGAFGTRTPVTGLRDYLSMSQSHNTHVVADSARDRPVISTASAQLDSVMMEAMALSTLAAEGPLTVSPVVTELLAAGRDPSPLIRGEALAALRGVASMYPSCMEGAWEDIRAILQFNVEQTRTVARTTARRPSFTQGGLPPQSPAVSESASTSPEDKAAQHAVKLLGSYLLGWGQQLIQAAGPGGTSPPVGSSSHTLQHLHLAGATQPQAGDPDEGPPGPSGEQSSIGSASRLVAGATNLNALWAEASQLLCEGPARHASAMIRSAALGVLCDVPEGAFASLAQHTRSSLAGLLSDAAVGDSVPAVRSAACKALGSLAMHAAAVAAADMYRSISVGIIAGLRDAVVSVRISACWALANLCDTLRIHTQLPPEAAAFATDDPHELSSKPSTAGGGGSTASAAGAGGSTPDAAGAGGPQDPAKPGSTGSTTGSGGEGGDGEAPLQLSAELLNAAVSAAGDVDKARANGVRALGNLLAFVGPSHLEAAGLEPSSWLAPAVQALQSCLATGNMKVQWNACYAVAGLCRNTLLLHNPLVSVTMPTLLLVLVMLVRDSSNYKIRTHAAAALAALPARHMYSSVYPDAMQVTLSTLEALESGAVLPSKPGAAGRGGNTTTTTAAGNPAPGGGSGDGDDAEDGKFPNYKYAPGLCMQLRATLLHLLSLGQPTDYPRLKDALARRAEFLQQVLGASVARAIDPAAASGDGTAAEGGAVDLPADPFGQGLAWGDNVQTTASTMPQPGSGGGGPGPSVDAVRGALRGAWQVLSTGGELHAAALKSISGLLSALDLSAGAPAPSDLSRAPSEP